MHTLREVSPSEVLATALTLVRSARTDVLATMDLGEELAQPLPEEYFHLLQQKMDAGVRMTRIGFGSNEQCATFLQTQSILSEHYHFFFAHNLPYRRMLMVDGKHMLFVHQSQNKKTIYYTNRPSILQLYASYFSFIKTAK